ncbi:hypothetical protein PMAYCL1PPCAC_18676 [Pristionchus mayeri]|uniref:Ric-8 n=1 Tax=Pristionchus mayeri TaxID=1317129 RepID=A0AAN5I2A6_9BILA|nr:hypothetical protein PMAYCL1PPCAC_18676 [Pristionchus mayeri]
MESLLTSENLAEWEEMENGQLAMKISKIADAASTQKKFSYDSHFKRSLSSVMCRRWPNASSSLRRGFCIILRCLCREKACIDALLSREIVENVIGSTGFPACCEADTPDQERMEACKCLINAFFHHMPSILVFTELRCLDGLSVAGRKEKDGEKRYLILHLAFVVSARLSETQDYWRRDAPFVHLLCEEALKWEKLPQNADEALKILFNLFCHWPQMRDEVIFDATDEAIFDECLQMARRMLLYAPSQIQNTVNLLACMPIKIDFFFPRLEKGETREISFEGREMTIAQVVMDNLGEKLRESNIEQCEGVELLGTYFTFLIKCSSHSKEVRRYCRLKILPPLHAVDVERPPEIGDALRNKIVRVMHSSCAPREAAAQFMFVLCKRNVNRLIKYTGLGNAAGLLANAGLLGSINEGRRESDSEDSETEDYREVEERVNPVTGYVREERPDPMEGMSQEQKEFEAEKLMTAMHKLMGEGVFKPATIGADGRPTTVGHVLELVKNAKTPEGSDSDSE